MNVENDRYHVLVVDDNRNNLFAMRAILERLANCQVLEAQSGEQALSMMLEQLVDLVLLDIQMPGMDGFEIASHMKMTSRTRHIPILFVTAVYRAEEFVRRGYKVGAVDYLTKPLDDNLLLNRVQLYLQLFDRERHLRTALADLEKKESQLVRANQELEHRVLERTHALEQTMAEQEESERKFRLLFEKMTSGWVLLQQEAQGFRLLEANPAFQSMTGMSLDQLVNQHLDQVMPEMGVLYGKILTQVAQGGEPRSFEGFFQGLDRYFLMVTYGLGKDRLAIIFTDLSERVRMEEALRLATGEAKRSAQVKSEFLATMSHEIRTPMNVVIGMCEVLQETTLDKEQREYLVKLNNAGNMLLGLINDILDLSKMEAGQVILDNVAMNPCQVANQVVEMMGLSAAQKGLELTLDVASDLPRAVGGDPGRFRQVMFNLINNAIKFTESGHIHVQLVLAANGTQERWIEVTVQDSGVGIGASQLEIIFDKFTQADSSITRRYGGTGLGLAISRRLVEMMGGTIWVESRLGEGSTFHVRLPVRDSSTLPATKAVPEPSPSPPLLSDRPLRILLAEDSLENQWLIKLYLKGTAHQLTTAMDGTQAVTLVRQHDFDLVLMDMQMPVQDGYSATQEIRRREALEGRAHLPILALTAYALEGDREKSLAVGCDDHLTKPIKKALLLKCIAKYAATRSGP